jgi:hypothetical protein
LFKKYPKIFRFAVRLGEYRISTQIDLIDENDPSSANPDDPQLQDIEILKKIRHKNYINLDSGNDIALLLLKTEATFTNAKTGKNLLNVKTICLPVESNQNIDEIQKKLKKGVMMSISGWGKDASGKSSDVLMHGKLQYVKNDQCENLINSQITGRRIKHTSSSLTIQDGQLVRKMRLMHFKSNY